MNELLRNYLDQFATVDLDEAQKYSNMEENQSLESLTYGLRIANLTLTEQMTVFLLEYGYTPHEIAEYRRVTVEAIYNLQRKMLKKIKEMK